MSYKLRAMKGHLMLGSETAFKRRQCTKGAWMREPIQREGVQGGEGGSMSKAKEAARDTVHLAGGGRAPSARMDLREMHSHTTVSVCFSDDKSMKVNGVS